ncbi:piwi-like protein 1 [Stylonychia lemnae]|uniref:Piwi-like protein 1 n=1 Tax=Stylonychia lemnae TaxID=5949 RepID=A0A078B7V2_STYLE|nr:piwi-like protein 1 [Stylonychia lemnae]|eukprot:CDW90464.1 piwi-like protein 1 [Stylonychia lemnae]
MQNYERSRSRDKHQQRGSEMGRGVGSSRGNEGFRSQIRGPQQSRISKHASIQLLSNHFKITLRGANSTINMYEISITPAISDSTLRRQILREAKPQLTQLLGLYLYYSDSIFSTSFMASEMNLEIAYKFQAYQVSIIFQRSFSLDDQPSEFQSFKDKVLNYVFIQCKKAMSDNNFKVVGRLQKFYNPQEKVKINAHRLEVWPGYSMQVKCLNDGIFLNVDSISKFISQTTIYDKIKQMQRERYTPEQIKEMLLQDQQLVVITKYNSRQYHVVDISFDITPSAHIFTWEYYNPFNEQKEILTTDMVEFFNLKWNLVLPSNEKSQPCLISIKDGNQVLLPASLCHEASLPKSFTKDSALIRSIQPYKLNKPQERFERIGLIIDKIKDNQVFADWDIKVSQNFAQIKAKQLAHPNVYNQYNMSSPFETYENKQYFHTQPAQLIDEKWALVYSGEREQFEYATKLVELMKQASRQLGIKVDDPQWLEIPEICSPDCFIDAIKSDIDPNYTQIIVVILPARSLKPNIKKYLDEIGLPSQFIITDTIRKCVDGPRIQLGPISMILKQINAKQKLDLYRLVLPYLRRSMIIGIDVAKSGNKAVIGLSASYNSHLTQYYSSVRIQDLPKSGDFLTGEERTSYLTTQRILIIELIQQQSINYSPMIIYALIDKLSDHRLFMTSNDQVWNPGPGTVVDTALVDNQGEILFDFYMIPHKAPVATALPVHFKIVYNSSEHDKNDIETFTYHLCYGYFNFVGPIKVPAAVMYAKKIANYIIDYKIIETNNTLSDSLHFL